MNLKTAAARLLKAALPFTQKVVLRDGCKETDPLVATPVLCGAVPDELRAACWAMKEALENTT